MTRHAARVQAARRRRGAHRGRDPAVAGRRRRHGHGQPAAVRGGDGEGRGRAALAVRRHGHRAAVRGRHDGRRRHADHHHRRRRRGAAPARRRAPSRRCPAGPADEPAAGLIGGPAPGGRTAVLVGYGPRNTEARRRPRRTGTPSPRGRPRAAAPSLPEADYGSGSRPHPPLLATAPDADHQAGAPRRPGGRPRRPRRTPLREEAAPLAASHRTAAAGCARWPSRRCASTPRTSASTWPRCAGSGEGGVITRADVDAAAAGARRRHRSGHSSLQGAFGADELRRREQRIPIKGVRKHTAAAMVASAFTAPHVTEFLTVDVTRMMKLRARLAARPEFAGAQGQPAAVRRQGAAAGRASGTRWSTAPGTRRRRRSWSRTT